jgi:hypothetical protein
MGLPGFARQDVVVPEPVTKTRRKIEGGGLPDEFFVESGTMAHKKVCRHGQQEQRKQHTGGPNGGVPPTR